MFVGALELDVLLGDVHSLKQKRSAVRPVIAELRRRFEVSAAEAGHLDLHRRALIGGLLGVLLGVIGSYAIGEFAGWRVALRAESIALAVGFAGIIGVFFGFYPARKASRLLPIEALRYE